ncbi:MAG: biopolymer transporter ExbD [Thiohalomonadaceae bacterium]
MMQEAVELNITAFLNLMVILVPFLLITAVFSRLTVLELNLPSKDAKVEELEKIDLQLELTLRSSGFDIRDTNLGSIRFFARNEQETDWKAFSDVLLEIKSRFPDEDSITLLLEETIDYKTLIQVMDRVRSAQVTNVTSVETVELFPNVSIGDAPPLDGTSEVINTETRPL